MILDQCKTLGLATKPDVGDNGVHASASPFEALAERANWLGKSIEQDNFGKAFLAKNLSMKTIVEWPEMLKCQWKEKPRRERL
jgi:hypothetical protein